VGPPVPQGGTAGLQTGGAAALNVRDLPVMKRFYVEVLGFRVEWEPNAENVYLTSGSDNLRDPEHNRVQIIYHPPISDRPY
jgi:catechol-2,3-dioxygenase